MRLLWLCIGYAGLGLAMVGTVTPIVPTVPFLIVAAYGFNRSSPRFHAWMMNHSVFGPQLRNWLDHRAIARRVKVLAIASMAAGLGVGYFLLPGRLWLVQVALLTAVALWIATRAEPQGRG